MLTSGSPRAQRGQWSLIGTLVAVAILIVLAALYLPRMIKPSGGESAQEQTAIQDANGVACTEYVSQMNQAVQSYKMDHDGQPPHSLSDLSKYGVTADMVHSPGCSFQMDPTTGQVSNGAPGPGSAGPAPGYRPAGTPGAAPPSGGTRGPGGVTIPNIPDAGGGM